MGFRRTNQALFLHDTWTVTPTLTVSLGLRYDYFGCFPSCEVDNRMSYFRPDLGGPFNVSTSQIPYGSGVKPDLKNFGPRAGIAYRIGNHTVVRSGFGLMYSPDPGLTWARATRRSRVRWLSPTIKGISSVHKRRRKASTVP